MNSNEEYLDSLLKAVTSGQGLETSTDADHKKPENDIENEFILDAPEWDEDAPEGVPDEISIDKLDFEETGAGQPDSIAADEDRPEEAALLDPGALFFEGEEETEDDLFISNISETSPITEESDDSEIGDLFFSEEAAEEEMPEDTASDDTGTEEIGAVAEEELEDLFSADDADDGLDIAADLDALGGLASEETDAISPLEDLEDLSILADQNEADDELEDLILAADSMEEPMEELVGGNDDEGFQEISDLLANAGDGDEEMLAMLSGVGEEAGDIGLFEEEPEETEGGDAEIPLEEEKKGRKKKAKKEKRGKKAKASEEPGDADGNENGEVVEEKPKKQGALAKFMDFLFEEEEEEETAGGNQEASIDELLMGEGADENAAILAELDKEKEDKKSGKKEKKKGKKGKKGKEKEAAGDGEEMDEDAEEEKGKKPKKEKKKKEKKEKEPSAPEEPSKKISAKKIQVVAILCLSVTAAIMLVVYLVPPALDKGKARDAYYAKDYEQVAEGFYGEKLSESDEIMYNRAMTILRFQRKIDAYNSYMYMGKETDALNQLIEAINRYEEVYEDAVKYNVIGEIDGLYQTVLDALQNRYGLSISRAMEIYAIEDDFEYTLMLESIVSGIEYEAPPAENGDASGQTEALADPAEQPADLQTETPVQQPSEGEQTTPEEAPAE